MNLKRFIKKLQSAFHIITLNAKPSYSQSGEDLIVQYLFESLKIKKPTYLDIGTNHPIKCNNTYLFYKLGSYGVCIEPDKNMQNLIQSKRPKSIVLNIGVGLKNEESASFYLFPGNFNGWSTFSKEEADIRKKETTINYKIENVPLQNINTIFEKYFEKAPNFISLDVEGLDLEILKSINFKLYQPDIICVETITFGYLNNTERKINTIAEFLQQNGYTIYADTHINTIFCKNNIFQNVK